MYEVFFGSVLLRIFCNILVLWFFIYPLYPPPISVSDSVFFVAVYIFVIASSVLSLPVILWRSLVFAACLVVLPLGHHLILVSAFCVFHVWIHCLPVLFVAFSLKLCVSYPVSLV